MKPLFSKVALVYWDLAHVPDFVQEELADAGVELVKEQCQSPEEVTSIAHDADLVWDMGGGTQVTGGILPSLERCGAILRTGSGTDNIPVTAATLRNIIVVNTPAITAVAAAEHMIGLLLAVTRKIALQDRTIRSGLWDRDYALPQLLLSGRTIGLIGLGHIGRAAARRLLAFDTRVVAVDPAVKPAQMQALDVVAAHSMNELLVESDVVSLHTTLTEQTHHLIGEPELKVMKRSAILVNTSRGEVVDELALATALRDGGIAGAALDVLAAPPASDHPLIGLDNIVMTPHIASEHENFAADSWRYSVKVILDMARGWYPPSTVNPTVTPRWPLSKRA